MAGHDVVGGQAQVFGQAFGETACILAAVVRWLAFVGEQGGVAPYGLFVGAPENVERPAWQLFTGVPLALTKMQEAALPVLVTQLVGEFGGEPTLRGAECVGVPFGGVAVADGNKGRLAAHGQAHVVVDQVLVHLFTQGQHVGPLFVGVGLGNAGRFVQAGDLHVVGELDLGFVHAAFDGCST